MIPAGVWVDGRARRTIDGLDRGLQYGDGLFETMRIRRGGVRLLDYHLDRLFEGCRRLALAPPGRPALREEIETRVRPYADGVIKLILTRGSGGRGYRPSGEQRCTRVLSLSGPPRPEPAQAAQRLRLCAMRLGVNPALAGLKTLNRLESVLARSEWSDERIWEGLLRDADGHVVCGTMSNLVIRRGALLSTPRLDRCGIAGVMRRWVLAQAASLGLGVRESRLSLAQLRAAEEVFMTNAVAGIVSIASIETGRSRVRPASRATAVRLRALLEPA